MTSITRVIDTPFSADAELCYDFKDYARAERDTQPISTGLHLADGEFPPARYRAVANTAVCISARSRATQEA